MSLKDAIKKFTDSVNDLSSLEVLTYTGKLEQLIDASTGQINWEEFKPKSGKLTLVAATLIRADHDMINFRAGEVEQGDLKSLLELHSAALESAQNGRLALIKMFSSLVGAPVGSGHG